MDKEDKTFPRLLVLSVFLGAGMFVVDLLIPLGVAAGVPYVVLVLVSLWSPQKKHTIIAAIAGTVLTILGFFFSYLGGILWMVLVNRFLALFVIWVTTILTLERKRAEEALQKSHDELESRVEERTAELVLANEKLQQEIEERKLAVEALRKSEVQYRDLYEKAPNAYFSINAFDGSILRCNSAALQLLGYDRETIMKMKAFDLYADTPNGLSKAKEVYKSFKAGESIRDVELQMKHKDGHPFWISLSVDPIRDSDGNITESRSIVIDISERKYLQAQLLQAQKMEAIGTLAGGIAHDFNNILSSIIGYTEIALFDKLPKDSSSKHPLEQVLKASNRAKNLVKQILIFSRQTKQKKEPLNSSLIVKEALKLLRASLPSTIEIRQNIQEDSGSILAEPTQIHQVLMNLCTNAAHAMREKGGVLEVSLSHIDLDFQNMHNLPNLSPGSYLRLTVKDTGYGIAQNIIDRIFDPYFTTKPKEDGTGLGLSVVHGIVKSLNGNITVASEPGKDTTFELFLPRIESEAALEVDDSTPILMGSERILFVDDEEPLVDSTVEMLQNLGYKVTAKTSSIEALEDFRTRPEEFDLVITDQTMPKMTGDKLAKEIIRIRPDIPAILCTGFSELITEEKAKEMGIREFVMKPMVRRDMAQTIRRVLDG